MTPDNCTCVYFYGSHINLCGIVTTPTSSIVYSIIYCICTQRVIYLYFLIWTTGTDYILASIIGLNWKFIISIICNYYKNYCRLGNFLVTKISCKELTCLKNLDTRGMYKNLLNLKFCNVKHLEHYRRVWYRLFYLRL